MYELFHDVTVTYLKSRRLVRFSPRLFFCLMLLLLLLFWDVRIETGSHLNVACTQLRNVSSLFGIFFCAPLWFVFSWFRTFISLTFVRLCKAQWSWPCKYCPTTSTTWRLARPFIWPTTCSPCWLYPTPPSPLPSASIKRINSIIICLVFYFLKIFYNFRPTLWHHPTLLTLASIHASYALALGIYQT